jgi:1A family penicillin-binding protein
MKKLGIIQQALTTIGRLFRRVFFEAVYFSVLVLVGITLAFLALYFFGTPDAKFLPTLPLAQTSLMYDRTGTHVLYALHGEENRKVLSHSQIPDVMRKATIAQEDNNFYSHYGVDFGSIARAFVINIQAERVMQGGSTITQQLARNAFFTRERTLKRKILETVMAFKIENSFSKDEILDMYLNRVPYGANAYGIEAASETYFGKSAENLTLDEAALIASLTKAPSLYSPYVAKQATTLAAKDRIVQRMADLNLISIKRMQEALDTDTVAKVAPLSHAIAAPHFVFYVLDQLEKQYGREAIETGGWKINTTIDWDAQQKAEKSVKDGVERNKSRNASNASLVAIDPKNGEILAMVGSRDFFDRSIDGEVNVATRLRQPGSSFKPLVYATAFEKGFQPETLLYDKPIDFGPDGSGRNYTPKNYNGRFRGILSMRSALSQSLNVPAVETLYLAGIPSTIDTAHKLGITTLNDTNRYGLALVLGGGEVKLLDMVSAFGVFSQEGTRSPVHGILSILDQSFRRIDNNGPLERTQAINVETARKINSILSDNQARTPTFGANSPLILPDRPVAAKTGTTQDFHDAWTIGYTPSLAAGVWAGNNDNAAMKDGADGVFIAAPIWHDFMVAMTANTPVEQFTPYTPVTSEKPLITGRYDSWGATTKYFNINTGEKISPEKATKKDPGKIRVETSGGGHSILYYVNKNDPLGATPPDFSDPMLPRWEGYIPADWTRSSMTPWATTNVTAPVADSIPSNGDIFMSTREYYGKQ